MARLPSSPGWYRDPSDPLRLRHWNGRAWDVRPRTVPAWAVGASDVVFVETIRRAGDPPLEGPVHATGLPATATATAQYARPAPRPGAPGRFVATPGTRRPGSPPPGWPSTARPVRSESWRPRAFVMAAFAIVGLAALAFAATVGFNPRPSDLTTLAQDTTFTRSANIACGEAMGAIRSVPAAAGATGRAAASPSPAAVSAANENLTRLARRIQALPVVDAARSPIQGWIDTWQQFATDRLRLARATARAGAGQEAGGPGSLASTVSLDAAQADAFATANGLFNCTLATAGSSTLTPS